MFGTGHGRYTPRQLYQLGGAAGVDCRLVPPAADLVAFVHYHWTLEIAAGRVDLPVIPDNALDLVLRPGFDGFAALYCPVREAFTIALEGPVRYAGSCLRLERVGHLLGHDLATLRELVPGAETASALALEPSGELLITEATAPELGRALDALLRGRLRARAEALRERDVAAPDADEVAPPLFTRFLDDLEPERIADMARGVGLSERQFRRETRRLFGLAPKAIQRVVRLQRALGELAEGAPPRADFHDDAHRVRELRALTGRTPGEIRRLAEKYNTDRSRYPRLRVRRPPPRRP